ncbi:MAG: UDP-N-acetylmuramate dehydrogenase [Patescibacteria group bacterium]
MEIGSRGSTHKVLLIGVYALDPLGRIFTLRGGWTQVEKENLLKEKLPGIQFGVSLKEYTTFRIGGPARYFFVARSKEEIIGAIHGARELEIPFFVLGGGSNLLICDEGFDGLVIHIQNSKFEIRDSMLHAEAGVSIATLVEETARKGLVGFEWAGGLPGTVGGAIRGNAGAFGSETKDNVLDVEALDGKGELKVFSKEECQFSYRSSRLKEEGWIVLSAHFRLEKGDREKIQSIAQDHILYRKSRHPLEYPNAGSIFKNYEYEKFPAALRKFIEHVVKNDPFPVVPAAYLISEAGLKGLREGNAQVSEKHPNYMVNLGNASSRDVLFLIRKVKEIIQKKFFIGLESEIEYVQ